LCGWRSKCAMRLRSSQSSGVIPGTISALALALRTVMQRLEASDTRGGSNIQLRARASRLCDQAKDGQILVDINVFSSVETLADVEFAGELVLKGFSRPVGGRGFSFQSDATRERARTLTLLGRPSGLQTKGLRSLHSASAANPPYDVFLKSSPAYG